MMPLGHGVIAADTCCRVYAPNGGIERRWPLGTADATVHHGGADDPVWR